MSTRTPTIDHHRAAVADRLHLMFKRGVAYADDQRDIAFAIDTMEPTGTPIVRTVYLRVLLTKLGDIKGGTLALSTEERVAVYVAAKAVMR